MRRGSAQGKRAAGSPVAGRAAPPHRAERESAEASGAAIGDEPAWMARLIALFADATPHSSSHWNIETGELFSVRSPRQRAAAEAFEERLFDEEGWVEVPWLESDDAFAMARTFVDGLEPGRGRAELARALDGPKPFRAFRAALQGRPGLQRRFAALRFEEAAVRLCTVAVGLGVPLPGVRMAQIAAEIAKDEQALDAAEGRIALSSLRLFGRARDAT